ncbi:vacuolar membrane-associated protein iml1 [Ascosphaera pollenicola]|nr:vacuolar membrane-associated protein iml1 [Ascosphaera pollenicola]
MAQDDVPSQSRRRQDGILNQTTNTENHMMAAPVQDGGFTVSSTESTFSESALKQKTNGPKFHFCPADVLILGLGLAIIALQAHVALQFRDPVKSVMLMRTPFLRISVRAVCLSISVFAALVAAIITSTYPYSELKTGETLMLPSCQTILQPENTHAVPKSYKHFGFCNEIHTSHVLTVFLLSTEAVAAFLVLTHWVNVKEMKDEGLPLTLGELLRMNDKQVNRALDTLHIQAGPVSMATKRRMVAEKLEFINGSPV